MADLGGTFDPNTIPESDNNFDPIPAGAYKVQATESEVVDIKSGNGQALVLTFEVVDGPYANRKLWDRLNIRHASEQAQSIAQRALADLFLATNTPPSRDSADLHFKPVMARVVIDAKDENYAPKNVIKGYKPVPGGSPPPAQRAAAPAARPAAASTLRPAARPAAAQAAGARPWSRPAAAAAQAGPDDEIPF